MNSLWVLSLQEQWWDAGKLILATLGLILICSIFIWKENLDLSKVILGQIFHTLMGGVKTSLNTYFVTVKKLPSLLSKMFDRYDWSLTSDILFYLYEEETSEFIVKEIKVQENLENSWFSLNSFFFNVCYISCQVILLLAF